MADGDVDHLHPQWLQAQAAVQAEMDQDVFDEAAGLVEAELSQVTFRDLIEDSIGAFIRVSVGTHELSGVLTSVRTATPAGTNLSPVPSAHFGVGTDWLIIEDCQAINLGAVHGLRLGTGLVVNSIHERSTIANRLNPWLLNPWLLNPWLRAKIGCRISVHSGSTVAMGSLVEVGSDFLRIVQGNYSEIKPLDAIESLRILQRY